MKEEINAFDYAGHICKALPKGVLLTTKLGDQINTMTIGWGHIGVEWRRPVFVAYVRESRLTKQMLDASGEFTVNIPYGEVDSHIISVCGTKSGRDMDKIHELGLTLVESNNISTPGIKELPLTLECKVLYKQEQIPSQLPDDIQSAFYPKDESGKQDRHTAYYAEIVGAYLVKD